MKYLKRIFTALVFLAGLVFLLVVASQIFIPKSNSEEAGMEEVNANGFLAEKENSIDAFFIGDSVLYSSVIPLQIWNDTGYTCYNCGSSGQRLSYSFTMLQRVFENQSPKIVFLEMDAAYRAQESGYILYTAIGEALPVFQYHDRWKDLNADDFYSEVEHDFIVNDKGYEYSTRVEDCDDDGLNYMAHSLTEERMSIRNKLCVQLMKWYCDKHDAKLVLISVPSPANWSYARHNAISSLADSLDCDYIDMNLLTEEIPIDWETETRDKGDHLNYPGAQKVTAYLTEYLVDSGLLESHKDDPDYASWDECYEKFMEEVG